MILKKSYQLNVDVKIVINTVNLTFCEILEKYGHVLSDNEVHCLYMYYIDKACDKAIANFIKQNYGKH